VPDAPVRPTPALPPQAPQAEDQPLRVLYIDDNPPNLRLMESILARRSGVTLLTAQDPALGLELALAHQPHVVLLDLQMAPMDGYEVLRHLRRHPETAQVPVIAITASALPRDLDRARQAGFDDCLTKPFDIQALLALLQRPPSAGGGRTADASASA
jgi:CheY-like chemotaxis protein